MFIDHMTSLKFEPTKHFGIIRGSFKDTDGGSHSFERRIKKTNATIGFATVSGTESFDGVATTRYELSELSSDLLEISSLNLYHGKIYAYSRNIFGEYENKMLIFEINNNNGPSVSKIYVEDDSVHNIRMIEIVDTSSAYNKRHSNVRFEQRNQRTYEDNTYSEADEINIYELNNDFLLLGVINSNTMYQILNVLEQNLVNYEYMQAEITGVTNWDIKAGDMAEIHYKEYSHFYAFPFYVSSKQTTGGQLLIDKLS